MGINEIVEKIRDQNVSYKKLASLINKDVCYIIKVIDRKIELTKNEYKIIEKYLKFELF